MKEDASGVIHDFGLPKTDDHVIAVSSSSALDDDSPVITNHRFSVDMARSSGQTGQMAQMLETSERERLTDVNIARCRSFAWDRAFFTNDGLLDAEELESMTEGGGEDAKQQLQGIEEKLCRSMDSISTIESDTLALQSLEAKLLEGMEASTQKSSGTYNLTNSSIKVSSGEGDSKEKASRFSQKGNQAATARTSKVTEKISPRRAVLNPLSSSLGSSTPIKTEPTRSSPLGGSSGSSSGDNVKSSAAVARRSTSPKTGKATADSTSKTPIKIEPTRSSPIGGSSGNSSGDNGKSSAAMARRSTCSKTGKATADSTSKTPIKTEPTRSSPLEGSSGNTSGDNVKSSATVARRNASSKTGKATADSTSKTPPGIRTKNKDPPINSRLPSHLVVTNISPRTTPASPTSQWSSGSSLSTSVVKKRSSSTSRVPHRSSVNNEKSSATNTRRKDGQKIGKPAVASIAKIPSIISFKNKLSNSSPSTSLVSSICQWSSESSSSTRTVDQRSISRGGRGTSVHYRSLNLDASVNSTLKNHPTGQTPDQKGRQPSALHPQNASISQPPSVQSTGRGMPSTKSGFFDEGKSYKSCLMAGLPKTQSKTGSSNGAKGRKPVTAHTTGLKPNSQKTTTTTTTTTKASKKQSSGKAKPSSSSSKGAKNLLVMSPEVLDIKGKINALKMEISNQKKDKSKAAESGIGKSSSKTIKQNRDEGE